MGRLVLSLVVAAACYRVDPVDCSITCADGACPSGLACREDGYCHSEGHTASCGGDAGTDSAADGLADGVPCSTRMVEIAAGFKHTCTRADDGAVWCWGSNDYGQHGDGTMADRTRAVRMVSWPPAVRLAAGQHHLCVIGQTGRIQCAGNNQAGQLGDGTTAYAGIPVEVVGLSTADQVVAGGFFTCVRAGGQLWCWGDNGDGQVGDGTTMQRHQPVRVQTIDNGTDLSNGFRNACAVRTGGSVYCWGYGWLGNGAPPPGGSPVPVQVAASGYADVASGLDASCGITTAGAVSCWGWNSDGQCGNGTTDQALSPVSTGISGAVHIALGPFHSCARLGDGTLRCWGQNDKGQLGNGMMQMVVPSPVEVLGVTDVADLDLGEDYTCAVRSDGTVLCWGGNDEGQLGDGTLEARLTPVEVEFTCP